jgi:hypothetical protein
MLRNGRELDCAAEAERDDDDTVCMGFELDDERFEREPDLDMSRKVERVYAAARGSLVGQRLRLD